MFGEWAAMRESSLDMGAKRRQPQWLADWHSNFAYAEGREITPAEHLAIRRAYSAPLEAMVDDVQITAARTNYAGERVHVGAH
jgi:hypothetical protein